MRKIALLVVFVAGCAFAQTEKRPVTNEKVKPVQTLIFGDGSEIDGEPERPTGELIETRRGPQFGSMIRLRTNFNDKLMQSVHEL